MMKIKWKKSIITFGVLSALLVLAWVVRAAPSHEQPAEVTYQVVPKNIGDSLYFSGILEPRDVVNIPSPADGIVTKKLFEYGQQIQKGDVLVIINSEELTKRYTSALNDFLAAKDKFSTSKTELKSSEELLSLGIISKSEFNAAKSTFDNARIAYQRALYSLKSIVKDTHGSAENIEKLDVSNFAEVDKALRVKYDDLKILAPATGVALLASTSSTTSDADAILEGSKVKTGQVILGIGNMNGLSAEISVNEVDIQKIKPGQGVEISGVAFPGVTLKGQVKSVASQAKSSSGSLPSFAVRVAVDKLSQAQQRRIKVGMTVKIKLLLPQKQTLAVPIAALTHKNGKDWLTVRRSSQDESVQVVVGDANHKMVEIKSGIKANDVIVYDREA